jgi:triphosphatase
MTRNMAQAVGGGMRKNGSAREAVKAKPVVLSAHMSPEQAYVAIVQNALAHMAANELGAMSGVRPEFLHQMRVALRRLRSALAIFPDAQDAPVLIKETRWLASELGAARDWDVLVLETLPRIRKARPQLAGIEKMRISSQRLRRAAWRSAQSALKSERYENLKRMLQQATIDPHGKCRETLPRFAANVLHRRYEKICKREDALQKRSWKELHKLRVAIKKMRYPVEFFSPLFDGRRVHEIRSSLTALQDILGIMNDVATAQRLVGPLRTDSPEMANAVASVEAWAKEELRALHQTLELAWTAFRRSEVFW